MKEHADNFDQVDTGLAKIDDQMSRNMAVFEEQMQRNTAEMDKRLTEQTGKNFTSSSSGFDGEYSINAHESSNSFVQKLDVDMTALKERRGRSAASTPAASAGSGGGGQWRSSIWGAYGVWWQTADLDPDETPIEGMGEERGGETGMTCLDQRSR